jgi:hypothetical protein
MGFSLGTGFLYNWGNGISGEQFIPENITGFLFSGLAVGENFNASASITPESGIIVISGEKNKNFGRFRFEIFTPYDSKSPINSFQKTSTIYSTGGVQNTGISKENFLELITVKREENIVLNRGLVVSGVSGNNSINTFISSKRNNRNYLSGNSWLEYSGEFFYNNFTGFENDDAGIILRDIGLRSTGSVLYRVDYGVDPNFTSGSGKNTIRFQNLKIDYPTGVFFNASNEKVWASYRLDYEPKLSGYDNFNNLNFNVAVPGTVNNSRNVFAYALEFIDIVTLRDSGTLVISGDVEDPFANLRKLEDPKLSTGFDTSFSNYLGYCFTRKPCPDVEEKEIEDVFLCWTGSGSEPPPTSRETATGRAYVRFLSGVRELYKNQGVQKSVFDGFSDLTLSSGVLVSGLFKQQTGQIIYNSFFSGDTISFKLYPFNYTQFYRSYHLGNNPLFPETGFSLRYPQDFTGIDTLVDVLNNRLSGISYPVWYPYDCLSGESTGIYITGGLMAFEKDLSIGTGNKNYNNIIKFRSLRNYERGFQLSLSLVDREEFIQDLELQYFRKGFSYLIPDVIELQARTGDQWLILDRRENLYNKFTGLERTLVPLNAKPELFLDDSNEDWLSSSEVTGTGTFSFFDFEELFLEGGYLELNAFRQRGFNPGNVPPYCPGAQGKSFERGISIVTPTGWPTGINGCDPKLIEEGEPCPEPIIPFCDESLGCVLVSGRDDLGCPTVSCECPAKPKEDLELFLSVLRTGWVLELTGVYLNCLTGPDFNPNKIDFPEYRFVARNFSGLKPDIKNQYLIPKRETYFTNVNLFSVKPSGIGIHEGEAKCLINSDYELQIQDIVALPFNAVFNYTISGEDFSGIYKALDQILTYTPTEEERNVKFVRRPGRIIGNATGLVNGDFTGRNIIEHIFVGRSPSGYFYNPEQREVYFTQKVSGFFERSGILNTGIFVLKEEIINFELLAGGRLDTTPEYIEVSGSGFYTGLLLNERYFQTGARGIYNLTGEFSGFSTSGFFDILIPTGARYTGDGFIEPFVSGRIFSGSPVLLQSGFESIVRAFPSENFISGNLSTLNSLVSGDFITSNNYIFRSPNDFSVFIINTGVITGTSLNPVIPFPNEIAVTGFGEYRDPNGFVFRNRVRTLMTGDFLVRRSDLSCFKFWPEKIYPLDTIATITGFTSNSFVSGRTGIVSGFSGNLLIDKNSFALLTGFTSTGFKTGVGINFIKNDYGSEIDIINSRIHLTRGVQYPIYNPLFQSDANDNNWSNNSGEFNLNPAYTLWNRDGWNNLNNFKTRQYTGLNSLWGGGGIGGNIVGTELIMWDFVNNEYHLMKFNEWTQGANGGGFSYIRSKISTVDAKKMYSPLTFINNETILIENNNIFSGEDEEKRIKGLYRIKNILTGNENTDFTGIKYIFSCLNDNDVIFNSPTNKNVYITSTGNLIGRPVFATQDFMSGTANKPFFPIPTGFVQASTNILFDFDIIRIFDKLSINNTTITYHPDSSFYPAPDYFNDLDSLLSIINTNPNIFNVTGTKLDDFEINLLALNDLRPGSGGNNLQTSTTSSGIFIPTNFLTGGETFYPIMAPTSLFSGFATGKVGVTGIFSETGSGIISGFVPTFTGIRTFTGIWNIKSGFNNNFRSYFANNLIVDNKYFSSQSFENESNIVQLLVSYTNQLNITENILDVAELKVKDLNYNKIFPTGDPDISDEIIFRITGNNTL